MIGLFLVGGCKTAQKPVATQEAKTPLANTLLWKVEGNGLKQPSFVYGTFHIMCKEDVNFSDGMQAAFSQSKELYLEMDLNDPATTMTLMQKMNMTNGKRLTDLYTPEQYQFLNTYFKDSLGFGLDAMPTMKPFFLQTMLYTKMVKCKQLSGVEQELIALAKKQNKDIGAFETAAFQAGIFDSIPVEKQAEMLLEGVKDMNKSQTEFNKMYSLYTERRLADLEPMLQDENSDLKEYMPIMLDNRNFNWISIMKEKMPESSLFMAVGAGHLVGNKGLLTLLKNEGYTVTPVMD